MDQGRRVLKIVVVLALSLACVLVSAQVSVASPPEGWYPLSPGSDDPAPPAVVLVTEELSESVVMVDIPGMFLETASESGTDYSRVTIPGYGELSETGFPELPVVPVVLAVPECDSLHVSVTVLDSVELTDVEPMPAPDWVVVYTPEGHQYLQSVFAPNG